MSRASCLSYFLPMLNNNFNQSATALNTSLTRLKSLLGPRFLLIVASLVLLIVVFIIWFPSNKVSKSEVTSKVGEFTKQLEVSGSNQSFIDTYKAALAKIPTNDTPETQYKATFNLAQGIIAEYDTNHDVGLKKLLVEIDNFVQQNYPSLYQVSDFSFTCTDTECMKSVYKPEIIAIKKDLEASDLVNKKSALSALYNSTLVPLIPDTKYANWEYTNLGFVGYVLKMESASGNQSAKDIEAKLLSYMKVVFPERFVESTMSAVPLNK